MEINRGSMMVFSGTTLAANSNWDGKVAIYETSTGNLLQEVQ